MSQSANPPGIVLSACLLLLGAGAIWAGIDAIVSDSVTTPSKYGSGARVHGSDTVLVGSGWLLIGLGLINRVIAGHAVSVTGDAHFQTSRLARA